MNVDGQKESSTHVQHTSHDPSGAAVTMDKPESKEGTISDTQGEVKQTTQSVLTDNEMPVAENDQNAHETSSTEHGGSSLENELSKLEPVVGNAANEMELGEHEENSQNEVRSAEHEVSKVDHAVDDEMEVGEHEVKTCDGVLSSAENEAQETEHEMPNDTHANSLSTTHTTEQIKNELSNVDNANTQHDTSKIVYESAPGGTTEIHETGK
jgi:vacuolar-type H+-ATPase subunit I/STV1